MVTRRSAAGIAAAAGLAACMGSPTMSDVAPPGRRCPAVTGPVVSTAVAWYHPVGAGDHERLEAWCRTLGPLVVQPAPSASFRSDAAQEELRVAAWNTNAGAGDVLAFLSAELDIECEGPDSRLRAGAPHFVLLLQEALRRSDEIPDVPESWATPPPVTERARPGPRIDIAGVATACGLSLFYAPAARNGHEPRDGLREDKGNAVLSTRPLTDLAVIELPYEAARRVVPVASVTSPSGNPLRAASVHLITTPPPWRVLVTANSARQRQAIALVDALRGMDRAERGASPTLAGGDLNTFSRRETALRWLREAFPASPETLESPTRPPFPTDHLLLDGTDTGLAEVVEGSYRRADDDFGSDHYPILALLTLGGRR